MDDVLLVVLVFSIVGAAVMVGVLLFSWFVRPIGKRPRGELTYECGFPAKGDARAMGFGFINYAVLFLIFDLAALYLFLYASMKSAPALVTVSFLLGIATLGLIILYGAKRRRYHAA